MAKESKRNLGAILLDYTSTITVIALAKSMMKSKALMLMVGVYLVAGGGFLLYLNSPG
ncbi:hypothetical protein ACR0ST_00710 [Aliidiomarina sp. Khilg15.8]